MTSSETSGVANIGVIGLAVMGSNLARNFAKREGNRVAIYNRTTAKTERLAAAHTESNFVVTKTYEEFSYSLTTPRTAIIMVQAGKATDAVIDELVKVFEPGDIIVDGGNSLYTDTIMREQRLREFGIHFVGAGISGGEEGALNGPSIMPGGSEKSWETLKPRLESIAAIAEGEPCVTHIGTDGAGHFVKMVHNGIEYADMQLIAESFDLLRRGSGKTPQELAEVFDDWNNSELESFLIETTREVLRHTDAETGKPFVDIILDQAGAKGTGSWTGQAALQFGVPTTAIVEGVFARSLSSSSQQREIAQSFKDHGTELIIANIDDFIEDVRLALYASKMVAYSQGFDLIRAAASEYHWNVNLTNVAKIWRGGCIIRAQFLNRIAEAYELNPQLELLLATPYFQQALDQALPALRRVVALAVSVGIPVPAFSSSLSYYDGIRQERLPAALIQGQRDFFGAHTYQRIDKPGIFHTEWTADLSETRLD